MKTHYCAYHQRFCIDELKRHTSSINRITCPNKYALCTECFILREGKIPQCLERIPGVRRTKGGRLKKTNIASKVNNNTTQCETLSQYQDLTGNQKPRNDFWVQVNAALRIQSKWRKHRLNLAQELKEYEVFCIKNSSAVKIQSYFRHFLRSKANLIKSSQNEEALPILPDKSNLMQKTIEVQLLNDNIHLYSGTCNKIQYSKYLQGNRDNFNKIGDTKQFKKHLDSSIKVSELMYGGRLYKKKCPLSACRLCNNTEENPPRRYNIVSEYNDAEFEKELVKIRKFITDPTPFKLLDPFGTGQISQRKFQKVVKQNFLRNVGHPLLPNELQSIQSRFSCHNGYINYEEYLHFASKQMLPCAVHGRFVCASPLCVSLSRTEFSKDEFQCHQFSPAEDNSRFCSCGKYVTHHLINPRQRKTHTKKRGLNIFSAEDMKRTLSRRKAPDIGTNLEFKKLNYCRSTNKDVHTIKVQKVSESLSNISPRFSMKTWLKTFFQNSSNKVVKKPNEIDSVFVSDSHHIRLPLKGTPEKTTSNDITTTVGDSVNSNSFSESEEFPSYTSFSPENLNIMLKECIRYRIPSIEKKRTIPCPLCSYTFFDETMLNKHLLRRHTKKEIENHLHITRNQSQFNHLSVQWIGTSTIVPPLPPPVPIDICFNHVPPHPKCLKCKVSIETCPLFPPIRFYLGAFFQYDVPIQSSELRPGPVPQHECQNSFERRKFHFDVNNKDFGIIMENGKIGKIEALCEDRFQRSFLGIKYYFTSEEFNNYLLERGESMNEYCRPRGILMDKENELILDSKVEWVNMTMVKDRCLIFTCNKSRFTEKKKNMGLSIEESIKGVKFCRLQWSGNRLLEIETSL